MRLLVYDMLVNVNGIYYVHVCEQARWARSAGNSAIENLCIIIIIIITNSLYQSVLLKLAATHWLMVSTQAPTSRTSLMMCKYNLSNVSAILGQRTRSVFLCRVTLCGSSWLDQISARRRDINNSCLFIIYFVQGNSEHTVHIPFCCKN